MTESNGQPGGGNLDYLVSDGEIFVKVDQVALLLAITGGKIAYQSMMTGDAEGVITAQMLLVIAEKFQDLRSELLKVEAEKSLLD